MANLTRCNYSRCKMKARHYFYRLCGTHRKLCMKYCDIHYKLIKGYLGIKKEIEGDLIYHRIAEEEPPKLDYEAQFLKEHPSERVK